MINITAISKDLRTPIAINKLLKIWEVSVRASHKFLSEEEINQLAPQAKSALQQIETLWVVQDGELPVGFMGVQEKKSKCFSSTPTISAKV
jgi:putative acetyltransferase